MFATLLQSLKTHSTPQPSASGRLPRHHSLAKRLIGASLLAGSLALTAAPPTAEANDFRSTAKTSSQTTHSAQWRHYRDRFVTANGRVVDTGNRKISHTESQGTGMLFSAFANDQASFDRIWAWTNGYLRRPDGLFAWKYDPSLGSNPVPESNNATDGDLMIAWALLMAGDRWGDRRYTAEANSIIKAMEKHVVEIFGGRVILRPADKGFDGFQNRVLNLSYCVFPALNRIARHTRSAVWRGIYRDCLMLTEKAGFGKHTLPLDWIEVTKDGRVSPAPRKPARFGYDAVRVPLYLIWGGHVDPAYIERYKSAWGSFPANRTPSWINPVSGKAAPYRASKGFVAIRKLVSMALGSKANMPSISKGDDYYSASLAMFANLAAKAVKANRLSAQATQPRPAPQRHASLYYASHRGGVYDLPTEYL